MFSASAIDRDTVRAYLETEYRVLADPPFVLKVGDASKDLVDAQVRHRCDCSALVTACNPLSVPLDPATNSARQSALAAEIDRRGLARLAGMGLHPSNEWPGEESFLVFGLGLDVAKALGTRFQQNAVVWMGSDGVPQLVLLR